MKKENPDKKKPNFDIAHIGHLGSAGFDAESKGRLEAAIIAAVTNYIQLEEEQLALKKIKPKQSNWLYQTRLESVRRTSIHKKGNSEKSNWKMCSLALLFLLTILIQPGLAKTNNNNSFYTKPPQAQEVLAVTHKAFQRRFELAREQAVAYQPIAGNNMNFMGTHGQGFGPIQGFSPTNVGANVGDDLLIRIGIEVNKSNFIVSLPDGGEIIDFARDRFPLARLEEDSQLQLTANSSQVDLEFKTKSVPEKATSPFIPVSYVSPGTAIQQFTSNQGYLIYGSDPNSIVSINNKPYRGALWIRPLSDGNQKTYVVNVVELEDYLLSVVPSEMPSSWPIEALKAQAIAARTYAIANLGKCEKSGFDLYATVADQVYEGVKTENEATNRAVLDTNGIIITHNDKPISAFFHSGAGGYTELAEDVWGQSRPYLQSVPDYDDASPKFTWSKEVSSNELLNTLQSKSINIGDILYVLPIERSSTNRVKMLLLCGSNGSTLISGTDFRSILKLSSNNFNIIQNPSGFSIYGRGYGHGVGMSQWGAKALAENGYNAQQIIAYYYKNVFCQHI